MSKMPNADLDSGLQVALNDFSLNFLKCYHQIGDKNRNLFYSPISLANAFSLVLFGADGQTKQELVSLFGYGDMMNGPMNTLEVAFKKVQFPFSCQVH